MTELTARDRLQPSLLDRLTDFEPDVRHEPRERRVLSQRALRDSVQRDIGWLLNASGLDGVQEVAAYPHVATSVLNYGLPDLAGRHVAGLTTAALERRIRDALWAFEPRLIRETVRVAALEDMQGARHEHVLRFEIEADMWSQPYPERLYLRTELDLEAGEVRILDSAAAVPASVPAPAPASGAAVRTGQPS
ncbi:type VI secretion system baseplate subunit TssE [Paraburkholderia panacisoli]|uniref:Type VI secretion system baseplate subunit TssE n=1 Tax=Paraburkholderia panacisoli TaxID=2603818 RepID=A0A5B0GEE0_9BURK|nr:type VI secretion system baseplate subunit TssE [Paraburkholderia panacisoli]KAA1000978.1 type VI secretion system baseplate subunit TssE [Paraburkholderia panacisoli]